MFAQRGFRIVFALVVAGLLGWWVHRERVCSPGACLPTPPAADAPAGGGGAGPGATLSAETRSPGAASLVLTRDWQALAEGLDYRVQEVAGGAAQLVALRIDLKDFGLEVVDLAAQGKGPMTVRALVEERQAVAGINGGYFDENWRPLGLLVHAGKRTNPLRQADWGIFALTERGPQIRHTREGIPPRTVEALQCGPRLVIRGRIPPLKPAQSSRAGIGVTAEQRVVLAVTARGQLSLREFALALKAFGCLDAMNLDGGPSAQLYARWGEAQLDLPGAYGVPSAIVVVPR